MDRQATSAYQNGRLAAGPFLQPRGFCCALGGQKHDCTRDQAVRPPGCPCAHTARGAPGPAPALPCRFTLATFLGALAAGVRSGKGVMFGWRVDCWLA